MCLCPQFFVQFLFYVYFYFLVGTLHLWKFVANHLDQVELSLFVTHLGGNFLVDIEDIQMSYLLFILAYLCDTVRMIFFSKFTVYYAQTKMGWRKCFLCPVPLNILKQMVSLIKDCGKYVNFFQQEFWQIRSCLADIKLL